MEIHSCRKYHFLGLATTGPPYKEQTTITYSETSVLNSSTMSLLPAFTLRALQLKYSSNTEIFSWELTRLTFKVLVLLHLALSFIYSTTSLKAFRKQTTHLQYYMSIIPPKQIIFMVKLFITSLRHAAQLVPFTTCPLTENVTQIAQ